MTQDTLDRYRSYARELIDEKSAKHRTCGKVIEECIAEIEKLHRCIDMCDQIFYGGKVYTVSGSQDGGRNGRIFLVLDEVMQ